MSRRRGSCRRAWRIGHGDSPGRNLNTLIPTLCRGSGFRGYCPVLRRIVGRAGRGTLPLRRGRRNRLRRLTFWVAVWGRVPGLVDPVKKAKALGVDVQGPGIEGRHLPGPVRRGALVHGYRAVKMPHGDRKRAMGRRGLVHLECDGQGLLPGCPGVAGVQAQDVGAARGGVVEGAELFRLQHHLPVGVPPKCRLLPVSHHPGHKSLFFRPVAFGIDAPGQPQYFILIHGRETTQAFGGVVVGRSGLHRTAGDEDEQKEQHPETESHHARTDG